MAHVRVACEAFDRLTQRACVGGWSAMRLNRQFDGPRLGWSLRCAFLFSLILGPVYPFSLPPCEAPSPSPSAGACPRNNFSCLFDAATRSWLQGRSETEKLSHVTPYALLLLQHPEQAYSSTSLKTRRHEPATARRTMSEIARLSSSSRQELPCVLLCSLLRPPVHSTFPLLQRSSEVNPRTTFALDAAKVSPMYEHGVS